MYYSDILLQNFKNVFASKWTPDEHLAFPFSIIIAGFKYVKFVPNAQQLGKDLMKSHDHLPLCLDYRKSLRWRHSAPKAVRSRAFSASHARRLIYGVLTQKFTRASEYRRLVTAQSSRFICSQRSRLVPPAGTGFCTTFESTSLRINGSDFSIHLQPEPQADTLCILVCLSAAEKRSALNVAQKPVELVQIFESTRFE